jgi:hypothetical protein
LPKSLVAQHDRHLHLDPPHKEETVDAVAAALALALAPESDLRPDAPLYLADVHRYSKRIRKKSSRKRKMKHFSTMSLTKRRKRIFLERKTSQRSWSPFLPRKGAAVAVVLDDQHLPLVRPETPLSREGLPLLAGSEDLLHRVVVSRKTMRRTFAVPPLGLGVPLLVANRMVPDVVAARLPAEMDVVLLVDRAL